MPQQPQQVKLRFGRKPDAPTIDVTDDAGNVWNLPSDSTPDEVTAFLQDANAPKGSAAERFFDRAIQAINPMPLVNAVVHPYDTAAGLVKGSVDQFGKMLESSQKMRAMPFGSRGQVASALETIRHGAASVTPGFGPAVDRMSERFASGDIAGGFGDAAAMAAGPKVAQGVMRVLPAVRPALQAGATRMWRSAADAGTPAQAAEILERGAGTLNRRNLADVTPTPPPPKGWGLDEGPVALDSQGRPIPESMRGAADAHAAGVARAEAPQGGMFANLPAILSGSFGGGLFNRSVPGAIAGAGLGMAARAVTRPKPLSALAQGTYNLSKAPMPNIPPDILRNAILGLLLGNKEQPPER
jgi:hypothetical protein